MPNDEIIELFNNMGPETYDNVNSHFMSIQKNLYFLNMLILNDLPEDAKILCVGVGTGADIIDLAKKYKKWTFIGIDPSESMLNGCRDKIKSEQLEDRCEFFQCYLSDYKSDTKFDAVLCLLVMHFIRDLSEQKQMYSDMNKFLKNNGYLIVEQISGDLDSSEFDSLFYNWQTLHKHAGATEDKLANLKTSYKEQLAVLPQNETVRLIKESGFNEPIQFFQSLLLRAWYAQKQSNE